MRHLDPKVSDRLAAELAERRPDEAVEVVIELQSPELDCEQGSGSRAARMVARSSAFDEWAESVTSHLRSVGGELIDRAWINSTLKGTVPAARVEELARDEKIERIDTPSTLAAE